MPSATLTLLFFGLLITNAAAIDDDEASRTLKMDANTSVGTNTSRALTTRTLLETLPPLTCPYRIRDDAFKTIGAFAKEHETMIKHLQEYNKYLGIVLTGVEYMGVKMPASKFMSAKAGWALSFLYKEIPQDVQPIYPLGDSECRECQCSKERMAYSFEQTSLGNTELFYFNRKDVDISTQAVPYLQHCGPLPGGVWTDTTYVAENLDTLPLQKMCATQMTPDNLNLCLGTSNIIMTYVDTTASAHANAMSILDGLRDQGVSDTVGVWPVVPKYNARDDDAALLQLLEGPFFWRFGQPRVASLIAYTQLIAACYEERPAGTNWGDFNGAVGWSSLNDAKEGLANLVQAVRFDLDDVHEGLREASVRAALRMYKKKYIAVNQTQVCKTKKKNHPKVYIEFRDLNPDMDPSYTGIDLSKEHTDYTGNPYAAARECFRSSNKCNKRAKDHPFYTSFSASQAGSSADWDYFGGNWRVFAAGCYNAEKEHNGKGENAVYLNSQDVLDYWQPEHSIISGRPSIARLDDYNENNNAGIGYGVDYYLDRFIAPLFYAKYDTFFGEIRAMLDQVDEKVVGPISKILDENKAAHEEYTSTRSGSGLRVRNEDQKLLSSTRLSQTATAGLSRSRGRGLRSKTADMFV